MVKLFTIEDGRTWNSHKTFLDRLARKVPLTEVKSMEECDVILEFYPVSSRPGHDIDAALKEIPANQPAILVMMHHTADPNRVVYDSSRYMSQSDVITVDCLFYEGKGLFTCPTNEEAVEKTLRHLKKYSKETPPPVQELPKVRFNDCQCRLVQIPRKTLRHLKKYSKKTPPPVQELPNEPPKKLTTAEVPRPGPKEQESPPDQGQELTQPSSKSLRDKIRHISLTAARNLHGISYAQILSLTQPELNELLPGTENVQNRSKIMDLIRQHNKTSLREKISNISPTAADNLHGISYAQILSLTLPELIELLPGMENIQNRREIMDLIRQHTKTTTLREKIRNISPAAADDLREINDAQIKLPELNKLLPGMDNFQKRSEIMELIRQHLEGLEHRKLLEVQERQLQAALDTNKLLQQVLDKLPTPEKLPRKEPGEGQKSQGSVASTGQASRFSPPHENPCGSPVASPSLQTDEMGYSPNSNPKSPGILSGAGLLHPGEKATHLSPYSNPESHGILTGAGPVHPGEKATHLSPYSNPESHGILTGAGPVHPDEKATVFSPNSNPESPRNAVCSGFEQPDKNTRSNSAKSNPDPQARPLQKAEMRRPGNIQSGTDVSSNKTKKRSWW